MIHCRQCQRSRRDSLSVLIMYIQEHQAQCGSMFINFLHVHTRTSSTQCGNRSPSFLHAHTRIIKHSVEAYLSVPFMCTQGDQVQFGSMSINFLHVHTGHQAHSGEACLLTPFMYIQGHQAQCVSMSQAILCGRRDIKHAVWNYVSAPFTCTQKHQTSLCGSMSPSSLYV